MSVPVTVRLLIEGEVPKTRAPLPVSSVTADARFADDGVARNVETFVPSPLMPDKGAAVAVMVPLPVAASEAPVPTTIAALVLVEPVKELNATEPVVTAAHCTPVPVVCR